MRRKESQVRAQDVQGSCGNPSCNSIAVYDAIFVTDEHRRQRNLGANVKQTNEKGGKKREGEDDPKVALRAFLVWSVRVIHTAHTTCCIFTLTLLI